MRKELRKIFFIGMFNGIVLIPVLIYVELIWAIIKIEK